MHFPSYSQFQSVLVGLVIFAVMLTLTAHSSPFAPKVHIIPPPTKPERLVATPAAAPLMFIENVGQFDTGVSYQVQGGTHTLWLAQDVLWITFLEPSAQVEHDELDGVQTGEDLSIDTPTRGVNIRLQFVGANPTPRLEPYHPLDTTMSYFIGNDPAKWHVDVPVWGGVRYVDLYPGIDLELSGKGGQFQPRLVVHNPESLNQVQLEVEGTTQINLIETNGVYHSIRLTTAIEDMVLPLFYPRRPDGTVLKFDTTPEVMNNRILSPFALSDGEGQTEHLGENGGSLVYSTYLGTARNEDPNGIAVDALGNAYVIGNFYTDFPSTPGVFETNYGYYVNIFVAKVSADGSTLIYGAFVGEEMGWTIGNGIAVDTTGNAYITGKKGDAESDVFIVKLAANGSALLYQRVLGGGAYDSANSIAVDKEGNAYITGVASDVAGNPFPTTPGAFDTSHNGGYDTFVTKLNADGSILLYSTFIGGSSIDVGVDIAVDEEGNAYLTGETYSHDFPTTPGAFDTSHDEGTESLDAFVTKLNTEGSALVYSTFIGGGDYDHGVSIALDAGDNAYITGFTGAFGFPGYADFPTTPGAFDTSYNGNIDAFISKLNPNGSALLYSTFLGGAFRDGGHDLAVDAEGNVYITGRTSSVDFPITSNAFDRTHNDSTDAFVTKLNTDHSAGIYIYSTFLGGGETDYGFGLALDATGNTYIAGVTDSSDFPTTPGAYDTTYNGTTGTFVTKLHPITISSIYLPLVSSEQPLAD